MAETRARLDWDHTAAICATVVNLVSKRKVKVDEFNPYRARPKRRGMSIGQLADTLAALKKEPSNGTGQ
jgi:hypothetical protein